MTDSSEIPVEGNCESETFHSDIPGGSSQISLPSTLPTSDGASKKLNSPNVRQKPGGMIKQQSFDPTMTSVNNKGIFRGRSTYSKAERPASTRSQGTRRPNTATSNDAKKMIPASKPPTPHSFRASSAMLNNFMRPVDQQHKPGQIPLYLGKTNKHTMESELHCKRNKFNALKRKLMQDQSDIMDLYRNILDTQQRVSKFNGKIMPMEKIELIAYVPDAENPNLWIKGNNLKSNACEVKAADMAQQLLDQLENLNLNLISKIKEETLRHLEDNKSKVSSVSRVNLPKFED